MVMKKMKVKKIFSTILLGFLAALLGGLAAAFLACFLHIIEWGQHLVWDVIASSFSLKALAICTIGGLLVGLCQRYLGDHPKSMMEAVAEVQKTGRLDYTHLPNGLVSVSCSLIFGASLGPEAAIVNIFLGLYTWIKDFLARLRTRLHLDRKALSTSLMRRWLQNWPTSLALIVITVVSILFLSKIYSGGLLRPHEPFQWVDLLWSIPLGILGAFEGVLFLAMQKWMRRWFKPIQRRHLLQGILGGFTLGVMALTLPAMLFSGQHQIQEIYEQAAKLGFWVLFLIAFGRIFLVNLLLVCGWKGGPFLPIMLSSAALGLSVTILFPAVPASAAILATMAALVTIVLPKPFIVLIVMAILFPIQYIGISAVGVEMAMLGRWAWKSLAAKNVTGTILSADQQTSHKAAHQ